MAANTLRVLFVCTVNRMRSATAHKIFEDDPRLEVKSAGTDKLAAIQLIPDLLEWADAIVVMEKSHRDFIRKKFPNYYKLKRIVCLYIDDDYEYMQPELIVLLNQRFKEVYEKGLLGFAK
jgi:predicted protein tyrosine phosphatase